MNIKLYCIAIVLAPLAASLVAGLLGRVIGKRGAHGITILGMLVSFALTLCVFNNIILQHQGPYNFSLYIWGSSGNFNFDIGFLVDQLSVMMMMLVTFVSLLVHIYSIGYMDGDSGYQRFFSYMSAFTFAMLMLVLANNFLTLFFGWEGVGLVSYLLIGFWYTKESAAFGSLKAFIVNRVGDMGMILGIAGVLSYFGSLDFQTVFTNVHIIQNQTIILIPGHPWQVITVICILLFIGAMGKSAQMPLHVWLPESMEGPTPISAMIHAATMVTAGVYMVARLSPMFELSTVALSVVLVLGAATCLFCGLIGVVQNDIKRVIAYSTLSQLGYMMAGVGASAFSAGMFHLFTHGFFKALLFLAAGSVIIANHHEQDMRKMGGLYRYMPITYVTFLIGALALCAIPPFSGFYSKDTVIDAVHASNIVGSGFAYWCVLLGAFVTGLYTFRAFFMTFHGKENMSAEVKSHLHESPWVVTMPLILLAIPSVVLGFFLMQPLVYSTPGLLGNSVYVASGLDVISKIAPEFHGSMMMIFHAFVTAPFWLAVAGILTAAYITLIHPAVSIQAKKVLAPVYYILEQKYGFDNLNELLFIKGTQRIGGALLNLFDLAFIDGFLVNGTGRFIQWTSKVMRRIQTGYLYHYAFAMVIGLFIFLCWRIL